MSELKNCPFCGSPAVHIKNNVGVNYITCSNTYEQSKADCVYDLRVNPKVWSRRETHFEITAIKGELKRERETVDKINKVSHYPTDGFISLERMKEFAREAQKQRKIEL